jgi:hypothetical protein
MLSVRTSAKCMERNLAGIPQRNEIFLRNDSNPPVAQVFVSQWERVKCYSGIRIMAHCVRFYAKRDITFDKYIASSIQQELLSLE